MQCTVPEPVTTAKRPTLPAPAVSRRTMALSPSVRPVVKFRVLVEGTPALAGKTLRKPAPVGCVTVTLTETALASGGTAHVPPGRLSTRTDPESSGAVCRESYTRQGSRV